jgi:hypothetical protein
MESMLSRAELRLTERNRPLNAADKSQLAALESELSYITKTKEAFVKDHPEMKDKVFRPGGGDKPREQRGDRMAHLYDGDGRLRDPTKSVYFDPVYNPFGVPPPGMPYKERSTCGVPSLVGLRR